MSGLYIEQFAVNPEAERLHQEGVAIASHSTDFEAAQSKFEQASNLLDPDSTDPSVTLQKTRIKRDDFFTLARIGIRDAKLGNILGAYHASIINAEVPMGRIAWITQDQYSPEAWKYFQAEKGASIGLVGRLATLSYVFGLPEDEAEGVRTNGIRHYNQAKNVLNEGSNRYYAASNAANAARHERIMGSKLHTFMWLGIGAANALEALKSDRPNAAQAFKTVAQRASSVRSIQATRDSVLAKP